MPSRIPAFFLAVGLLAAPAAAQKITGRILPPPGGTAAYEKVQVELTTLTPDFRQLVRTEGTSLDRTVELPADQEVVLELKTGTVPLQVPPGVSSVRLQFQP